MKNICFAYITPFHPERGGIGRVTHTLTLEFQKRGYNVFYLIYPCGITIRHEYDYPAPLEYLPSGECLSKGNVEYYYDYLKRNKIDVVINQSGNFSDSDLWLKASDLGIKVISVLHSNPWVSYSHLWQEVYPLKNAKFTEKLKRIARVMLYFKIKKQVKSSRVNHFRRLLPKTDKVCLLSSNFYGGLSEIWSGYEQKYVAIQNPNSFDIEQIKNIPPKKKQILFVGLFGPPKNEQYVVKLWRKIHFRYPDWTLIMVGDGNEARVKRLHKLARDINNIRFVGFQNPLPYYMESSIFCMTSAYEGWPMVLTEAMQCGCVPIAFNSFAAVTDIIEDGKDGLLVLPFSLKEYESKLCALIEDDARRAEMGQAAQRSVQRFDVSKVADKWEQLFNELH